MDGAELLRPRNTWPALEVINYSLDDWPNSNNRPVKEQITTKEWTQQASTCATTVVVLPIPKTQRDPSNSQSTTSSEDKNPFLRRFTQQKTPANSLSRQAGKQKTPIESNPLKFTFRTLPAKGPKDGPNNVELLVYISHSRVSSTAALDAAITISIKESKTIMMILGKS